MLTGGRVWHVSYGRGYVEALVAGRRARVRFDGAPHLPRTVLRAELRSDPASAPAAPSLASRVPATPRTIPLTPETAGVRQTLEALRMGVVPSRHVEDYTVGRETELQSLGELLEGGGGFRAIWGGYGAGKTHLLDVFEHLALSRGFATARVVLDPAEVPPTHPKRLYRSIVQNLRLPGSAGSGFEPLAHALCESGEHRLPAGSSFSPFYSPYLHALHAQHASAIAVLRDYVAGEDVEPAAVAQATHECGWRGPRALALSDFRTYGRMYLLMLGTLATWIRDAGHRGLVLLFDEVEYLDALYSAELGYALEVLQHFAAVTAPPAALAFDPDELYRGGHAVHRELPLRFRADQPLSVVFALTPLQEVRELYKRIVRAPQLALELPRLRRRHLDELFQRVEELYVAGYPGFAWTNAERLSARTRVLQDLDDDVSMIRSVVQRTVCVLDEHRYHERFAHGA